jgi:hypothetical protein
MKGSRIRTFESLDLIVEKIYISISTRVGGEMFVCIYIYIYIHEEDTGES